jgi:hypothetical protein
MTYEDIINNDKITRPQHYRYLLHKNKDMIGPFLNNDLTKIENNYFVSDTFKPIEKNKKNMLFAGCSITVGCGLDNIKKSWSYKLYNERNLAKNLGGYFNVGCSGASPIEIILNILKYIAKYGCPDYIFILFPNFGRDWYKFNTFNGDEKIKDGQLVDIFIFNLYSILEDICKTNNAKLFSTSWVDPVEGITDYIQLNSPPFFEEHMHLTMMNSFKTYYKIDKKRFAENVYSFIQDNDKAMGIIGNDGSHPSEAVHYAWFKEAEFQLQEAINVDNGN